MCDLWGEIAMHNLNNQNLKTYFDLMMKTEQFAKNLIELIDKCILPKIKIKISISDVIGLICKAGGKG